MTGPRVVVVGGGVVGLCCAYYLARDGARVVVLERDAVGAGASSGNAGTISAGHPPLNRPGRIAQAIRQMADPTSPLYVHPHWNPGLWRWLAGFARYCTKAHVEHSMRIMAPLGQDALALFDELIREERIECEYRADGYYEVCLGQDALDAASHEAEIIRRHGYHPEHVDGEELRRREPEFSEALVGGIHYPEAATLDPSLFLGRLSQAARRLGAEVREGFDVTSIDVTAGRAVGVRGRDGRSEAADAVVLATGPFVGALARRLGVRIPVQPGKGYHRDVAIGPNGAPRLRVACVLAEASVFCTPLYGFVRFAGTMEFSGENRVMRPRRLRQLTRAARACFPSLGTARPQSEWCGLRPMSVDGLPIVGGLGGVDGLFVATGHGMLGLTLGPVTGQIVSNLIFGRAEPRAPGLDPVRFS